MNITALGLDDMTYARDQGCVRIGILQRRDVVRPKSGRQGDPGCLDARRSSRRGQRGAAIVEGDDANRLLG